MKKKDETEREKTLEAKMLIKHGQETVRVVINMGIK